MNFLAFCILLLGIYQVEAATRVSVLSSQRTGPRNVVNLQPLYSPSPTIASADYDTEGNIESTQIEPSTRSSLSRVTPLPSDVYSAASTLPSEYTPAASPSSVAVHQAESIEEEPSTLFKDVIEEIPGTTGHEGLILQSPKTQQDEESKDQNLFQLDFIPSSLLSSSWQTVLAFIAAIIVTGLIAVCIAVTIIMLRRRSRKKKEKRKKKQESQEEQRRALPPPPRPFTPSVAPAVVRPNSAESQPHSSDSQDSRTGSEAPPPLALPFKSSSSSYSGDSRSLPHHLKGKSASQQRSVAAATKKVKSTSLPSRSSRSSSSSSPPASGPPPSKSKSWFGLPDINNLSTSSMSELSRSSVAELVPEITDVDIRRILGSGSFGNVYLGTWTEAATEVALKQISETQYTQFEREALTLSRLRHPNIVSFLGVHRSSTGARFLVFEYLNPLQDILRREQDSLTIVELLDMIIGTAKGMAYLEQRRIVHRDLALRNLLVARIDGIYCVKITDFGMSREEFYQPMMTEQSIPVRWSAPEVLTSKKLVLTSKSDVWSFGVTVWEILEFGSKLPYTYLSNRQVVEYVVKGERLSKPDNCPDQLYEVMLQCWAADPDKRPSFLELTRHLKGLHITLLLNDNDVADEFSEEPV